MTDSGTSFSDLHAVVQARRDIEVAAAALISAGQQLRALPDAGADEVAQLLEPRVGDSVKHLLAVAAARDDPGDGQSVQVLRDVRHGHPPCERRGPRR